MKNVTLHFTVAQSVESVAFCFSESSKMIQFLLIALLIAIVHSTASRPQQSNHSENNGNSFYSNQIQFYRHFFIALIPFCSFVEFVVIDSNNVNLQSNRMSCSIPFEYVNPYYHELTARTCANILGYNKNRTPNAYSTDYGIGCDCMFPFARNYNGVCIDEAECNEREAFGMAFDATQLKPTNGTPIKVPPIDRQFGQNVAVQTKMSHSTRDTNGQISNELNNNHAAKKNPYIDFNYINQRK